MYFKFCNPSERTFRRVYLTFCDSSERKIRKVYLECCDSSERKSRIMHLDISLMNGNVVCNMDERVYCYNCHQCWTSYLSCFYQTYTTMYTQYKIRRLVDNGLSYTGRRQWKHFMNRLCLVHYLVDKRSVFMFCISLI